MSEDPAELARQKVDAVYRSDSRRVLATLIRLLGDFDLAEEALHDAFTAAVEQWPREGVPANPRAWLVSTGRFKAIDALRRRARFDASLGELAERLAARPTTPRRRSRGARRRPAAADLHLLPSRAAAGRAGGADAARGLRPDHRGDRARLPHPGAHGGAAHRARQGEDPRRAHSLSGAVAGRARGATRCRPSRDLPRLQRGILGVAGRVADPRRSLRRGDPPGPAAARAAAGARGDGAARADAAPRIAARRAHVAGGRARAAGRSGSLALGPRADRRGRGAGPARAGVAPLRPVHAPGGDRGGARRGSRPRRRPTGRRSSASTTCSCAPTPRRWSS